MRFDPLIFIVCRDRVTDLRSLVDWLERAGHERIAFLDNDSAYEPLLDYYEQTPHTVIRLRKNLGCRALWLADLVPDEWFVVTDPDVLPIGECPLDAVEYLHEIALRHSQWKAALGLHLDDVPADLPSLAWERDELLAPRREIEPGVFDSLSDTTFALHAPGTPFRFESLRTSAPYQVRHLPWYVTEPSAEEMFYLERCKAGPEFSSWAQARGVA